MRFSLLKSRVDILFQTNSCTHHIHIPITDMYIYRSYTFYRLNNTRERSIKIPQYVVLIEKNLTLDSVHVLYIILCILHKINSVSIVYTYSVPCKHFTCVVMCSASRIE